MPVWVTKTDGTRYRADEAVVELPQGLDIRRIVLRMNDVVFIDADGHDSLTISRSNHPGAGMAVDFAGHIKTQ